MVVLDNIIITGPLWATHYAGVLQVENHVVISAILKPRISSMIFRIIKTH